MKRTFKNFDEYSEYYENREHKMNDVDVVENTVTVCADGEFECKNWKTAVRRFFKEINDNSLFDGWKECITECVENGIWKEKEEYNGKHVCGGWFWEVECIDEGFWYVSLTVSKEIEEESESAETVESVEETTVSETVEETAEQEETEVKTKMYWAAVRNKETNQLEVIKRDDYSSKKDFAHDLRANGYAVRFISTPDKFDEDCENYYWECEKRQNVRKCVSESKERMETAEQETELNAEVEAEQTAETETISKSKSKSESESEPTAENITVSGTNQVNINVLIVVDIANTFETITHTGYFDTS